MNEAKKKEIIDAIIFFIHEALDMDDSYEEIVEVTCHSADLSFSAWDADDMVGAEGFEDCEAGYDVLEKMHRKALGITLDKKPKAVEDLVRYWIEDGYLDVFRANLKYEEALNIEETDIFKNLTSVLNYVKESDFDKEVADNFEGYVNSLKNIDFDAIRIGTEVANSYYAKLSSEFGLTSNDVFTVGHVIQPREIDEFPCYEGHSYVFHKDVNRIGAPETSLATLVKTDDDNVYFDISLERTGDLSESGCVVGIVGYIFDFCTLTFSKDTPIEDITQGVVEKYNELFYKLYDIANNYPTLYRIKPFDAPLENVVNTEHISDDRLLLDSLINRWTTTRGDKTKAIGKGNFIDGENFKIRYANSISPSGDYLEAEYTGGVFTLRVLDKEGTVIYEESKEMSGSFNENSPVANDVRGRCLMWADIHLK